MMRSSGISGIFRRFGKLGKIGLVLLIIGIVGGIALSSISNPRVFQFDQDVQGRTVIHNEELLGLTISFVEMRVSADTNSNNLYSMAIVPVEDTGNVFSESDLEEYAVAYQVDVQGANEISHSQVGGAQAFDVIFFSANPVRLQLEIYYNIAIGTLTSPFILGGIVLIVIGIIRSFLSGRKSFQDPFAISYNLDGISEAASQASKFGDSGAEGEYAMEQMVTRSKPEYQGSSEKAAGTCPSCGAIYSESDLFCPNCFTEI